MLEWKEKRIVPDMNSVHVMDGCENVCEECEDWGEKCETCNVSVPLVADKWEEKEITYTRMTICGIPVGEPYKIELGSD